MSDSRVIVLQGHPILNEHGVAAGAITPGMLVQGVSSISAHSTSGGAAARTFALEREYMGETIDDAYAVGDVVKVASFSPGDVVNGLVVSGAISAGSFVESNGDGYLKVYGSGIRVGRVLENVGGGGSQRAAVEIY
jgi:hypothetical protein